MFELFGDSKQLLFALRSHVSVMMCRMKALQIKSTLASWLLAPARRFVGASVAKFRVDSSANVSAQISYQLLQNKRIRRIKQMSRNYLI